MAFEEQQPLIPSPETPLLKEDGNLSREWRRYLEDLYRWLNNFQIAFNELSETVDDLSATVDDHEARITALEP